MNIICSICHENLQTSSNDECATPCGHVFHFTCLTHWLESSPSSQCPECRKSVGKAQVIRLHLNFEQDELVKIAGFDSQMKLKESELLKTPGDEILKLKRQNHQLFLKIKSIEKTMTANISLIQDLTNENLDLTCQSRDLSEKVKSSEKALADHKSTIDRLNRCNRQLIDQNIAELKLLEDKTSLVSLDESTNTASPSTSFSGDLKDERTMPSSRKQFYTLTFQAPPDIPEDEIPSKVRSYVEYNFLEDDEAIDHAVENFRTTFPTSSHTKFLIELFLMLIDRRLVNKYKISTIISELLSRKCISSEHFHEALKELIDISFDILIDFPYFWNYMALLLVRHAINHGEFLSELKSILRPPQESFISFVAQLMLEICELKGPEFTKDIWKKSKMNWTDFVDNQERIEKIVKLRNLDFLL